MTGPARGPHAWVPEFVQLGAIRGSSFLFMPGLTVTFVIPGFAVLSAACSSSARR